MYAKGVRLTGFGKGPYQTLAMRVRGDSEVVHLDQTQGVVLLVRAVHHDGGSENCRLLLDLETKDLSCLIVQLQADLDRKLARLKSEHEGRLADLLVDLLFSTKAIKSPIDLTCWMDFGHQYGETKQSLIGKLDEHGIKTFIELFSIIFKIDERLVPIELGLREVDLLSHSLANCAQHEFFLDETEQYRALFDDNTAAGERLRRRIAYEAC